jgi:hypothetical protein
VFLDPNSSCEQLQDYGFQISPSSGACGKKGVVESIDGVEPAAKNTVNFKVGDSCDFITCSNAGSSCIGGSDGNLCVTCSEIATDNSGVTANDYTCSQAQTRADAGDSNEGNEYICLFDSYLLDVNECVAIKSSGENAIRCPIVQSEGQALEDPCTAYEDLSVDPAGPLGITVSLASSNLYTLAQKACESDPCHIGQIKGYKGCHFTPGSDLGIITSDSVFNTCTGIK